MTIEEIDNLFNEYSAVSYKNSNKAENIELYHKWYDNSLVFFDAHFSEDNREMHRFCSVDNNENGYGLYNNFSKIRSSYMVLSNKIRNSKECKNHMINNQFTNNMDLINKASSENNKCFIITPIGNAKSETREKADGIINNVIKPILNELEIEPVVPHESNEPGSITSEIINEIIDDKLVIANLTGLNPNVMYELAIRHSFAKPVVCIFEKGTILPFDIKDDRAIEYEDSIAGAGDLKEKLKGMILAALKQKVINNPVTRAKRNLLLTTKEQVQHIIEKYMDKHTMTDEDIDDLWTKEIKN